MSSRLDLAVSKGCDGIDADNVESYLAHTGFSLTYEDQIDYNTFLAFKKPLHLFEERSEAAARPLLII